MAKPFETAGFKNAIIAKDPPTKEEDPILVQRIYSVRYVASTTRNAIGPSVSDPEQERLLRVISFGTTITCVRIEIAIY
jgi:hypothetical protein